MKISFYLHVWQGVLMFLLGIVCVLASFGGYLLSGGGEELLRRALLNVTSGKAKYDSLELNWHTGRIEVMNIQHEDFAWPKDHPIARLKNLKAPRLSVQLEGWPAVVKSITVEGLSDAEIEVDEGFLQQGNLPDQKSPKKLPQLKFEDCTLKVVLGGAPPLVLGGCRGELKRDEISERLQGGFSVRELNGKPFDLTVESLENGRWVLTGNTMQLDTRAALSAAKNPFAQKFDPVGMLMKALFSGEMGAQGTLTSLHISVQPATEERAFSCEGEVGYSNLTMKLPAPADKTGRTLPFFLGMLLGVDEKQGADLWPRLLQVDQITTGEKGRVAFHMADGRLDFSCDEGTGSAFTGVRDGLSFPALESLKGSVETDASSLPKRIVLRGFLGSDVSFEARVVRGDDRSRTTELVVSPRPGNASKLEFGRPLWRFESRVKDYVSVSDRSPDQTLAEFEAEATVHGFPRTEWLPPGMTQLAGRIFLKGNYKNAEGGAAKGSVLYLDDVRWSDGAGVIFGGVAGRVPGADFHPFWEGFYGVFATEKPWMLRDLDVQGGAEISFDSNLQWHRIRLNHWAVKSAAVSRDDAPIVFAPPELALDCDCTREPSTEAKTAEAAVAGSDWSAMLKGHWVHDTAHKPSGDFIYSENSVPITLHPNQAQLTRTGVAKDGRVQRSFSVQVRPNGVKVDEIKR